ncbi:nucleoside deaminase [Galbitalea sp. SE-J8]|uniref:nucleoside deaminase n=1 Tax=Galbitalea sp. SE-J8 TaxID=3054952 RepID=UPI00259D0B51|nr:nucleoside deaminase [Galbitalea sp. SE-J8]MDM4762133.1 nucleoside deaminase [Galbitalea sp. SE-J8]
MTATEELLRRAIAIATSARGHGNHPFGALLTDAAGAIAFEAENTVVTEHDPTGHAETNLVRNAARALGGDLSGYTLYTSTEPCAMCSGAIYWSGISRVVFALSEAQLYARTGAHPENPTLQLPSREVFAHGQREIRVEGPFIEDEAAAPHKGFWG